jgi:hypothetical protein
VRVFGYYSMIAYNCIELLLSITILQIVYEISPVETSLGRVSYFKRENRDLLIIELGIHVYEINANLGCCDTAGMGAVILRFLSGRIKSRCRWLELGCGE